MISFQLPSSAWVHMYEDGRIEISKNGVKTFTQAAELAYILQKYQKEFGGFPAQVDLKLWRGIEGGE